MKLEIEVDVPEDSVDKRQLEQHLQKEALFSLFADRKIPAAQVARQLHLTRRQFMELCQHRGIPIYDYAIEDFNEDEKTLDLLWPEIENSLRHSGARCIK